MRRAALIAAALLIGFGAMSAQAMLQLIVNFQGAAVCPAQGPYTGPGDVVSSATGWWGLRAYSLATTCSAAIRVLNAAGSQKDIKTLANGALDINSATAFAGTHGTCQGTISSTTLTVTSCTGTPQALDGIAGAGITQPAYITVLGTCAGGSGTCTLNKAQTVGSAETITINAWNKILTLYDQSGGNNCSSAPCPATVGNMAAPILTPDCGNGLPCLNYYGTVSTHILTASTAWPNQPLTISAEATRNAANHNQGGLAGYLGGTNDWVGWSSSASQAEINYGAALTATASDTVAHAFQFVVNNTSSAINVDGTTTSGSGGSSNPGTQQFFIGQNDASNNGVQFYENEVGIWPVAFTGTQQTNVCHNQHLYWGTATSC